MLTAYNQHAVNCYAIPENGANLLNKVMDKAQHQTDMTPARQTFIRKVICVCTRHYDCSTPVRLLT
jgi:hypothetical protein